MAVEEPIEIRLNQNISALEINVRSDLVDVRGRITDLQGRPIAGAKVRGEHYPMPDSSDVEKAHPARFALSGTDGSYELRGFVPLDVYRITGYLVGGDPTESGLNPFYVKVYVDADGFVQGKENVPKVPLVTEELLGPARRLLKAMSQMSSKNGGGASREEGPSLAFQSRQHDH